MVGIGPQVIDGTALTNRYNRQKRHNWHYLLPKCYQICPAGQWADCVGQPNFLINTFVRVEPFKSELKFVFCSPNLMSLGSCLDIDEVYHLQIDLVEADGLQSFSGNRAALG
jgi:hypothetical protein